MIDFDDQERKMLRTYFDALDDDGSGSIDVSELEEVMVALGLAEKPSDVEKMVANIDEDGSGEIEFHEFLSIVFKSLIRGDLGDTENIGFKLLTSAYRRKRIMDAMMGKKESAQQVNEFLGIDQLRITL
ncbi:centrin 3, putative [Perkinsus marinus ATCC 50983]|uniref:Calmodulin n=1 Tax=Perkinsus marinus (strain ATCC 50983 / TXsc) TaxID=423536 RepID=C5KPT4_PERM5|nr:centrin 3, putative [Perkinsus marinus ATCC 50983]EER13481.1 centrin 3, putative [Perkinsus marinus ATCC 50983]|eukprot:XP_002781686.1 centrin 3, putative [Perkinsus marinus ATCC 50983]